MFGLQENVKVVNATNSGKSVKVIKKSMFTDDELKTAFSGTNYGTEDVRKVLEISVIKLACDYGLGSTTIGVLQKLGLASKRATITTKGSLYLRECLKNKGVFNEV